MKALLLEKAAFKGVTVERGEGERPLKMAGPDAGPCADGSIAAAPGQAWKSMHSGIMATSRQVLGTSSDPRTRPKHARLGPS